MSDFGVLVLYIDTVQLSISLNTVKESVIRG